MLESQYQKSIEKLVDQTYNWFELEKFETVAEHITVLFNAFISKKPDPIAIKMLINILNKMIFDLLQAKAVHALQVSGWIEKTLRLASTPSFAEEKKQLLRLQENLRNKLNNSDLSQTKNEGTILNDTDQKEQNIINAQNMQYREYSDQMVLILSDKLLPISKVTELVKKLKMIILKLNNESVEAPAEIILSQTLLLCQHYKLDADVSDLSILQSYWYDKKPDLILSQEEAMLAEERRLELEIKALEIIQNYHIDIETQMSDDLSQKLILQILTLCVMGLLKKTDKNNDEIFSDSLSLMYEITKQFLIGEDIGLAYRHLGQAIELAEKFNLSAHRNHLALAQGDLFAQKKQGVSLEFGQVDRSLKHYFEVYFDPQMQENSSQIIEIELKISNLETRVLYQESKDWIISRLVKSSQNLSQFKVTFESIHELGHRLVAYGEFDLAWHFYANIQPLLTQSTQNWHENILVELAQISSFKQHPQLNNYPQKNDWQKHRNNLMNFRQELSVLNKPFGKRQEFYAKSVMRMIAGWMKDAESLLGKAPDQYCLLGLGSMSRLTLAPYSDLECVFLVSDNESVRWEECESEKPKYFSALYRLFELKSACLGEIRGFRLDEQGHARAENRLRGTPSEVLRKNHPGTQGVLKDDEMTFSVLSPIFLYGERSLFLEYQKLLEGSLEDPVSEKEQRAWKDVLAVNYLPLHCKYYKEHDPFISKNTLKLEVTHEKINIKKDYISPLMYAIADISLHYRRLYVNTTDFMEYLEENKKITPYFAKAILCGTQLADEIRVNLHLFYGEQNDEVLPYGVFDKKTLTLTQKQQWTLDLIAWGLMRPLRFVLENLQSKLQEKDDLFLVDPIQAMIMQAFLSNDNNALKIAVQCALFALALGKADVDNYRLVYLKLPQEARRVFQQLLSLLAPFLTQEKILAIKQSCLDCPLPNGLRENQQEKENLFNAMISNLIVNVNMKDSKQKDGITLKWINSRGEIFQGNLHSEVVKYLAQKGYLKDGKLQITPEKIAESDGRHMVIPIDLSINQQAVKIHLKIFPEMPGMECAVGDLARLLVGFGAPYTQLARLETAGKVIPVLLSQTIIGKPLHTMIQERKDELNQLLNPQRFHQRILLAILLNQEDAKPSNFILHEDDAGLFEMICVDNDRSFFPAIVEEDGRLVPIVKEISYCFSLMQEKVNPIVAADICYFDAYALLSQWLLQLDIISIATDKLFSLEEMQEFFPKKGQARLQQQFIKQVNTEHSIKETVLPITFSEHTLASLYVKLRRLQDYLKSYPDATLFDLLCCAEPYLAKYYRNLIQTFPSIVERFQNGFSELYGEKREKTGAHQTKKTTFSTLQTLHGKPQDAKTVLSAKNTTLKMAREELKKTHEVQQNWENIYNQIMEGNPEGIKALSQLPDMRLREIIINKIDFGKLSLIERQALLNTLTKMGTPFRSLKLINCNITDEQLTLLLINSSELEILVLNNCPLLTDRAVLSIAKNCPILETLVLTNLTIKSIDTKSLLIPQLFTPIGGRAAVVFSELRSLDVSDCKELNKLCIEAPRLSNLKAKNCIALKSGKLRSRELHHLDLSDCFSLTTDELSKFVTHFPYLKSVQLDGCKKIEKYAYYMEFPYLLRINLSVVTDQYVQGLTALLERNRSKSTDEKQITELLDKLHEYFDVIENSMSPLMDRLEDPSADVQREAVLAVQEMGRNGSKITNQLEQQLSATQPGLRAAAAITLCSLGYKDQKTLEALQQVFAANDERMMNMAIPLLNQFGSESQTESICLSILEMEKISPIQRKIMINIFGDWQMYSEKIIDGLKLQILSNKDSELQAMALCAYWKLENKHLQKADNLLAWIISQLADFTKMMPVLLILMTKFNSKTAFEIRQNLQKNNIYFITNDQTQSIIQQLSQETEWQKRVKQIESIGENQIQHPEVVKILIHYLQKDIYYNVRVAAIKAITQLEIKDSLIDDILTQALDDKDFHVVSSAVKAFEHRGVVKAETQRKLLALLLKDEHHLEIREPVLLALGTINEFNKEIVDCVIKCLSDKFVDIKKSAIKALVKLLSLDKLEVTLIKTFKGNSEILIKRPFLSKSASLGSKSIDKPAIQNLQKFSLGSRRNSEQGQKLFSTRDAFEKRPTRQTSYSQSPISSEPLIKPQQVQLQRSNSSIQEKGQTLTEDRGGLFMTADARLQRPQQPQRIQMQSEVQIPNRGDLIGFTSPNMQPQQISNPQKIQMKPHQIQPIVEGRGEQGGIEQAKVRGQTHTGDRGGLFMTADARLERTQQPQRIQMQHPEEGHVGQNNRGQMQNRGSGVGTFFVQPNIQNIQIQPFQMQQQPLGQRGNVQPRDRVQPIQPRQFTNQNQTRGTGL